jgi:hypothetical protein
MDLGIGCDVLAVCLSTPRFSFVVVVGMIFVVGCFLRLQGVCNGESVSYGFDSDGEAHSSSSNSLCDATGRI